MKERPILFSGAMVRAILEGKKTQTRRVGKPVRHPDLGNLYDIGAFVLEHEPQHVIERACPYGQPGDRLYVREGFSYTHGYTKDDIGAPVWYWADGNPEYGDFARPKPSIHMPRWASRILLEVTGVRVERLNDISKADAIAEGAPPSHPSIDRVSAEYGHADFSRSWYAQLWDQINGAGSWDANPWVWVVEFKRVEGGAA